MIHWPGTTIVKSNGNAFTAHLNKPTETSELTRVCKVCNEEKAASAFYVFNRPTCRACVIARNKASKERHGGAYMRAVA